MVLIWHRSLAGDVGGLVVSLETTWRLRFPVLAGGSQNCRSVSGPWCGDGGGGVDCCVRRGGLLCRVVWGHWCGGIVGEMAVVR